MESEKKDKKIKLHIEVMEPYKDRKEYLKLYNRTRYCILKKDKQDKLKNKLNN